MTLGQFATIVGAPARWVQNARAVLRLRGRYDDAGAMRLGLARTIGEMTGMSLVRAYAIARDALAPAAPGIWTLANADGSVGLTIDVERYLAAFATRQSLAHTLYTERTRGPRRARSRDPIAAARRHGVDVSLFDESLKLTPAERLRRMDQMSEFFRTARVVGA